MAPPQSKWELKLSERGGVCKRGKECSLCQFVFVWHLIAWQPQGNGGTPRRSLMPDNQYGDGWLAVEGWGGAR